MSISRTTQLLSKSFIDADLKALCTTDFQFGQMFRGNVFQTSTTATIANGASAYIYFLTGNSKYHIVTGLVVKATGNHTLEYFVGTTVTPATGIAMTYANRNVHSSKTGDITFLLNPTVTGDGTLIAPDIVGASTANVNNAATITDLGPFPVAQSTAYSLKLTNNSGSTSTFVATLLFTELTEVPLVD